VNYRETLFLVGKCLTLDHHPEKIESVVAAIDNKTVEWEKVVHLSSGQLVLPALYLNLKRASLLEKLPADLTEYLEYLTNENRERNKQILEQVDDIAETLQTENIKPVFLKGVAHLLLNLYNDPAERMIGDIDFLVKDEEDVQKAAALLMERGYEPPKEKQIIASANHRHFPVLRNYNYSSAVEIHREVVLPPHHKKFNAHRIYSSKQSVEKKQNSFIPSIADQIIHNMLNVQINDKAYRNFTTHLRPIYDLFLLSRKENAAEVLNGFGKYEKRSNSYLAVVSKVLHVNSNLEYKNNRSVKIYVSWLDYFLEHLRIHRMYQYVIYFSWRIGRYISLPVKAIFNKQERLGLWYRLSDRSWYGKHLESYRRFFKE
jgi:hypothetical protein